MEDLIPYPEDFDKQTDNIYEAVMVLSRRARKIGADQKLEIERFLTNVEAEEENEEEVEVKDEVVRVQLEKPTIIAVNELKRGDLEFEYVEKNKS